MAALAAMLQGCTFTPPEGSTPPGPAAVWVAQDAQSTPAPAGNLQDGTPELQVPGGGTRVVSLTELIEFALKSNPHTRSSWLSTQSAYASLGMEHSAYYPQVSVGGQVERIRRNTEVNGAGRRVVVEQINRGTFTSFDWLLFDFGNREARIDEQKQALIAANYQHNSAVQQVVLGLQRSFYQYVALRFLARSQEVTIKDAETSLDAAEQRRRSGMATVADVLQARTALSRARYALQSTQGQIAAVRGAVLTAAGLSPSAPIDVGEIAIEDVPPPRDVEASVEELIRQAEQSNPQLAAARAAVTKADTHVKTVRTIGYPSLVGTGLYAQSFRSGSTDHDYDMNLSISVPLFTGFSYSYELQKARLDAERALADYRLLEDERSLAVWTDYYACRTAAELIRTSQDLIKSASESHEVELGRYREGLGSIIDLLAAEAALADARAANVRSYADWFISLAQLRYDVGSLRSDGAVSTDFSERRE